MMTLAPFPELVTRATTYLRRLGDQLRADGLEAEAAILDAQALLAADPMLATAVAAAYCGRDEPLALAISASVDELAAPLEALDDAYLRERAADVRAAGAALLRTERHEPIDLPPGTILFADELMPADIVSLPRRPAGRTGDGRVVLPPAIPRSSPARLASLPRWA